MGNSPTTERTKKAVRVSVRPEVMQHSFQSPFVQKRREGVPSTEVPLEISRQLIEGMLGKGDEDIFTISEVFEYPLSKLPTPTFNLVACNVCGEIVAENKARLKDGNPVCSPCSEY